MLYRESVHWTRVSVGNSKSTVLALSQQAHACLEWRPMENCLWTFHTNPLLHRDLFPMYVHE